MQTQNLHGVYSLQRVHITIFNQESTTVSLCTIAVSYRYVNCSSCIVSDSVLYCHVWLL